MAITDLADYLYSVFDRLKSLFCPASSSHRLQLAYEHPGVSLSPSVKSASNSNLNKAFQLLSDISDSSDAENEEQAKYIVETGPCSAELKLPQSASTSGEVALEDQLVEIDLNGDEERSKQSEESSPYEEKYRDEIIHIETEDSSLESTNGEESYDESESESESESIDSLDLSPPRPTGLWSTVNSRLRSFFVSPRGDATHNYGNIGYADVQRNLV